MREVRGESGAIRLAVVSAVVVAVVATGFFLTPSILERYVNGVVTPSPYAYDHAQLAQSGVGPVVDLHADTLLWRRDAAVRGDSGHVDVPRLREGDVTLQVFSAVTKTPRGLNFESNAADSDNITALVIAQLWPPRTWFDLTERALFQAQKLQRLTDAPHNRLMPIRSSTDLHALLETRRKGEKTVGALLAIEGLHAIDGSLDNLERLYDAGYRMMGLTHFFDNAIGGSAHGMDKGGLTPFGAKVIRAMEQRGIVVDLAHASPALIDDVLDIAENPVVVSHTGVRGTCDRTRNLSDDQVKRIAAQGGLIGIAFFDEAICGVDTAAAVAAIRYVRDLAGIEHVAFGSDFDGAVTTPFDVAGLPLLVLALRDAGFSPNEIRAVAGGNAVALLDRVLPKE